MPFAWSIATSADLKLGGLFFTGPSKSPLERGTRPPLHVAAVADRDIAATHLSPMKAVAFFPRSLSVQTEIQISRGAGRGDEAEAREPPIEKFDIRVLKPFSLILPPTAKGPRPRNIVPWFDPIRRGEPECKTSAPI